MFRKLKVWFRQDRSLRSLSNLYIFQDSNDPRELPRPDRSSVENLVATTSACNNKDDDAKHGHTSKSSCNCKNCREILDNFAECAVCMEPLQGAAICSCMFCGNYMCWPCSEKVVHCPFCRAGFLPTNENRIRNFALERVLAKLELPCRNARWGCTQQLGTSERTPHESSCEFAPPGCPLVKLCGWHGDSADIARHLKDTHDLTLIAASGINVEIADFRVKLLGASTAPRLYTVSLTCHGNIYICKLKMLHQKLRIAFLQVSGDATQSRPRQKYGAWLEIATASRTLRGTVEISARHKHNRELIIPGSALIYNARQGDDFVRINISIRPMPAID